MGCDCPYLAILPYLSSLSSASRHVRDSLSPLCSASLVPVESSLLLFPMRSFFFAHFRIPNGILTRCLPPSPVEVGSRAFVSFFRLSLSFSNCNGLYLAPPPPPSCCIITHSSSSIWSQLRWWLSRLKNLINCNCKWRADARGLVVFQLSAA